MRKGGSKIVSDGTVKTNKKRNDTRQKGVCRFLTDLRPPTPASLVPNPFVEHVRPRPHPSAEGRGARSRIFVVEVVRVMG